MAKSASTPGAGQKRHCHETRAPDGYEIDTQSQTIQIQAGRTVSLTFKNEPRGALIIQKRDRVTASLSPAPNSASPQHPGVKWAWTG